MPHDHLELNAHILFLLLALIFAGLATFNVPGFPRFSWFPASFFAFLIAMLLV